MFLNDDWEFNVLGVYNYRKPGPLRNYFDYIIEHHDHIEGDICEAGVFKGRSLLATGLLLKELGSSKQVYGYDSFQGFPPVYNDNDDVTKFDLFVKEKRISEEHYDKVRRNTLFRSVELEENLTAKNISLSGDFSGVNIDEIERKIKLLELENINFIPGPFSMTMITTQTQSKPQKIMAALLDCDLYSSYEVALPFIWERMTLGGYIYLDEYYSLKFPGARIATDNFFVDKIDKPLKHKQEVGDFERWYVRKLHIGKL